MPIYHHLITKWAAGIWDDSIIKYTVMSIIEGKKKLPKRQEERQICFLFVYFAMATCKAEQFLKKSQTGRNSP